MAKTIDQVIAQLGAANDQLHQLEDIDYPTAQYKGYSASGDTLEEVQARIRATQTRIDRLQAQLDLLDEQLD